MIKIHKTYLHERPEAPRDAPARRLDDRRRLRRVLADAPPAEALEGAPSFDEYLQAMREARRLEPVARARAHELAGASSKRARKRGTCPDID